MIVTLSLDGKIHSAQLTERVRKIDANRIQYSTDCPQMPKEQSYRLLISALKALLFLFFSTFLTLSRAADFGRLTVLSSLGQPLRAEVELSGVSPEEAASLVVRLAPEEAYKRSGMDYTALLRSLNISVEKADDRNFVSIRSAQPIREPYIGVLLELAVNNERRGREFAITLDPAEWTNLRAAPLSATAFRERVAQQQQSGRQSSQALSAEVVTPASVMGEKEAGPESAGTTYVVVRGDSLSKIAARLGYRNISLEQMLVALYRSNPDAFLDKNMNLLRKGAKLSIPPTDSAAGVTQEEAQQVVKLHAANFREYSRKLAGMAEKSAPGVVAKTGPVAEGKISASVKEPPTPVSQSPDRLELSRAGTAQASAGISAEEKIAMKRAIEDANRRITDLEKNVSELRSLLEVVSKGGHALTSPAQTAPDKETGKLQPDKTEAASPQTATGTTDKAPSGEKKEGLSADQTLGKAEGKADTLQKKQDEESEEYDQDGQPVKKQGLLYKFKNNIIWQIVAGVIGACLVLIVFMMRSRGKKPPEPARPAPVASPPVEKKEEEVNPNIISGRDFLENLTAAQAREPEEEDDEEDIREIEEAPHAEADPEPEPVLQTEPEPVPEEPAAEPEVAVVQPEVEEEPEVEPEAPEEVVAEESQPEPENTAPEITVPEEAVAEPESAPEPEPEPEPVPEGPAVEPEVLETSAGESDLLVEDDVALRLDDHDAPADEQEEAVADAAADVAEPHPLELDLSDISPVQGEAHDEDVASDDKPVADSGTQEPVNAEMAAKLELALAYMDMKDKEGARELLEEVIERGTPQQIIEAKQAMQYL
ncbi:MAG: hypothetical protein LBM56_02545 [Burkholderiaceae bacterium]|jgi:FimV-like protein|nr:hypothetical protein [Burkholderiaceae bacterium]